MLKKKKEHKIQKTFLWSYSYYVDVFGIGMERLAWSAREIYDKKRKLKANKNRKMALRR